jgi:hypothetical protein
VFRVVASGLVEHSVVSGSIALLIAPEVAGMVPFMTASA